MRTREMLTEGFGEIQTLFQYLYMNEEHSIVVSNGVCNMEICMDEELRLKCKNLNFPNVPASGREIQLTEMLAAVDQLKHQPAEQRNRFKNRWKEIETITSINLSLNRVEDSIKRMRESCESRRVRYGNPRNQNL